MRRTGSPSRLAAGFVLAVLTAPGPVAAAPCDSTPTCLAAVEKAQRETASMKASFVQVKHLQLLDEPIVSRGQIFFRRPDRMRLEIQEPVQSTVLIRGRDVSIPGLSERDRQAMSMAPASAMFAQLGAVFTGATEQLQEGFEVAATPAAGGVDVVLLPRLGAWRKVFRRMQIHFAGEELKASTIELDDALGDRLEVTLENVQLNLELADSLFQPAAPETGAAPK